MPNTGSIRRDFLLTLGTAAAAAGAAAAQSTSTAPREPSKSDKAVRIGLIGCGGRGTHLTESLLMLRERGEPLEVVAVCDVYQPRLERAATKFSAKYYADYRKLIADPSVDAVVVATPDRVHVYNALEAVRAGKDVYCEKPITHWRQFDQLKELRDEVRRSDTVFQVGAQWTSDPIWRQAAELIKKGEIGKPVHAQTSFFRRGDWGERGMPIDDPNAKPGLGLDWEAFRVDAPERPFSVSRFFQWRMYMDYAGGPSTDVYVHRLTPLLKALGGPLPKTVVAVGGKYFYDGGRDVPDTFDLLIEYPQGMTVVVLGSIVNDTGIDTVIRGSDGTITFEGEDRTGLRVQPQPEVPKKPREIANYRRYELDHLQDFLHAVRARRKPGVDIELAYAVQVPLIMSMLSFVEGKVAHFDPASEQIRLA